MVGGVEARRVLQIKYRPELPAVLRRISLTIEGCSRVGIAGRTGSGTGLLLVLGLWVFDCDWQWLAAENGGWLGREIDAGDGVVPAAGAHTRQHDD